MGGGASKRKYQPAPEPEPEPEREPETLFTLVIDLDGSGNLAPLHFRDDHPDAESAAREFVAKHGLHHTQLDQITGAVARKMRIREETLAEEERRRRQAEEDALKPHVHTPDGSPAGRAKWYDGGIKIPSWEHQDDRPGSVPPGGGLLGMKHLTSAVNLAKLRDASRYGKQRELLEALLEGGLRREDVDTCGDDGFAPLHLVARGGWVEMAKALVLHGADVHKTRPPEHTTAVYMACQHGHIDLVRFLVGEGADPALGPDNDQSLSPLGAACQQGHLRVVKYLVEECGVPAGKWREAAVYGRLSSLEVVSYLTDWLPPSAAAAGTVAQRSRMRWLEYGSRTVPPQCESGAHGLGITEAELRAEHKATLHLVERVEATSIESRGLLTARQHLAFAQAIEAGRKASSKVLGDYLRRCKLPLVKKRVAAFEEQGVYSLNHLQHLIWEFDALQQSTPPYGLLRTVFRGTKGNSREIDIAGLGLLKAKVKEGTRPVDRLGLYRPSKDEELRALFDELDSDGSGGLSKQELADVVPLAQLAQKRRGKKEGKSKPLSSAELSKMMKDIDADGDGEVDFGEFRRWWRRAQGDREAVALAAKEGAAPAPAAAAGAGAGGETPDARPPSRADSNDSRSSSPAERTGSRSATPKSGRKSPSPNKKKGKAKSPTKPKTPSKTSSKPKTPSKTSSKGGGKSPTKKKGKGKTESEPARTGSRGRAATPKTPKTPKTPGASPKPKSPNKKKGKKSPTKSKGGAADAAEKSPEELRAEIELLFKEVEIGLKLAYDPRRPLVRAPEQEELSPAEPALGPSTSASDSRPTTQGSAADPESPEAKSPQKKSPSSPSKKKKKKNAKPQAPSRLTELLYSRYEEQLAKVSEVNGLRVLYELTRQAPCPAWDQPSILERILYHGHSQPHMSGGEGPTLARHEVLWRKDATDRAVSGAALFRSRVMKKKMEREKARKKLIKDTEALLTAATLLGKEECALDAMDPLQEAIAKALEVNDKKLLAALTEAERNMTRLRAEEKLHDALQALSTKRPVTTRKAIEELIELEQAAKDRGTAPRGKIMQQSAKLRTVLEAEVVLSKRLGPAAQMRRARDREEDIQVIVALQKALSTGTEKKVWGDLLREANAVATKLALEIELARAVVLPTAWESLPEAAPDGKKKGPQFARSIHHIDQKAIAIAAGDDPPAPGPPEGSVQVEETDMDAVRMILWQLRQPPPPPLPATEPPEAPASGPKPKGKRAKDKKKKKEVVLIANHSFKPTEEQAPLCLSFSKGDSVVLDEGMGAESAWWIGHLQSSPDEIKAFPRGYVRMQSEPAPPPPPLGTARCVKETDLRDGEEKDSNKLGLIEEKQKVQVLETKVMPSNVTIARVLLLDDAFAEAKAKPPSPSSSEDSPRPSSTDDAVTAVVESLVKQLELAGGGVKEDDKVEAEPGAEGGAPQVLTLEEMPEDDDEARLLKKYPAGVSGRHMRELAKDGPARELGELKEEDEEEEEDEEDEEEEEEEEKTEADTKAGETDTAGDEEEEEDDEDEDETESDESTHTPRPERVGWCSYIGAPKQKKKKAAAGQPYFAQRRFTVVIERSWVGSTHFCDGEAFPVSAGSASAMEPPLSSWDERLGNAIDAAVQAGVDEGSKLLVAARTARAVRASWFRCAKEAAEEELARITDVQPEKAHAAATKIQANVRGKTSRRNLNEGRAATKIQANVRGKAARKQKAKEERSVTKIQARARGRSVRKNMA